MIKNHFVFAALLSFSAFGLHSAESGELQIVDKDGNDVWIGEKLCENSMVLKKHMSNRSDGNRLFKSNEFDVEQLDKLEQMLQWISDFDESMSPILGTDLLSKNYDNADLVTIATNESFILFLSGCFQKEFFPGKEKLGNNERKELTDLFRVANSFEVYPALAAIVDLRGRPEKMFTESKIKSNTLISAKDLSDLMIARVNQRKMFNQKGEGILSGYIKNDPTAQSLKDLNPDYLKAMKKSSEHLEVKK